MLFSCLVQERTNPMSIFSCKTLTLMQERNCSTSKRRSFHHHHGLLQLHHSLQQPHHHTTNAAATRPTSPANQPGQHKRPSQEQTLHRRSSRLCYTSKVKTQNRTTLSTWHCLGASSSTTTKPHHPQLTHRNHFSSTDLKHYRTFKNPTIPIQRHFFFIVHNLLQLLLFHTFYVPKTQKSTIVVLRLTRQKYHNNIL